MRALHQLRCGRDLSGPADLRSRCTDMRSGADMPHVPELRRHADVRWAPELSGNINVYRIGHLRQRAIDLCLRRYLSGSADLSGNNDVQRSPADMHGYGQLHRFYHLHRQPDVQHAHMRWCDGADLSGNSDLRVGEHLSERADMRLPVHLRSADVSGRRAHLRRHNHVPGKLLLRRREHLRGLGPNMSGLQNLSGRQHLSGPVYLSRGRVVLWNADVRPASHLRLDVLVRCRTIHMRDLRQLRGRQYLPDLYHVQRLEHVSGNRDMLRHDLVRVVVYLFRHFDLSGHFHL
jgi:hypothetical protein